METDSAIKTNNTFSCSNRSSIIRNYRPFTTDSKQLLALWNQSESWNPAFACPDSDIMVVAFTEIVQRKIEENCPLKTFKTNCLDNEFTTPAIQRVRRQKGREYVKHGNSPLFKVLKKKLKATIKDESKKFITKQVDMAGDPCSVESTLPQGVQGPEPNPLNVAAPKPCHSLLTTENKKYVDDCSKRSTKLR